MGADKGKKTKLSEVADEEEGDELLVSVEKLQEIQDDLEKINEEASDKVLEVEQKYNEIRRPVYNKRNMIIQSFPDFWLTAFLSHPVLGDLFTDNDQKIFKHLVSLDVEDFKDVKSGYCITFNFSENPYFEDQKLTKTFSFSDEGTTNISCTAIKWKEGMEIPNGKASGKKGKKRPLTEESFFSWFTDNQQKILSDAIYDEFAEVIKEDLWPNPLKYFQNEADMEEFDGEDEEKSSDDENEEDDDAEQDDDEEEED